MTAESRRLLFAAAQAIADYYGDGFVGRIEINVFKGGVGSVNVSETFRPETIEPKEGRGTK